MYATVFPTTDGLNFTPGPDATSLEAPLAISNDTRRVSLPATGLATRLASVCSFVMQYAITRRLSAVHFGLPQKLPCSLTRFRPVPSG